jgi:hypothetical protein
MGVEETLQVVERLIRRVERGIKREKVADAAVLDSFCKILNCYNRLLSTAGQSKAQGKAQMFPELSVEQLLKMPIEEVEALTDPEHGNPYLLQLMQMGSSGQRNQKPKLIMPTQGGGQKAHETAN